MEKYNERLVCPKAERCFDFLNQAIQIFEEFLSKENPTSADFYGGRNRLRDAELFYKDTIKNAKKLLGPIPEYVTLGFQDWKTNLLRKDNILIENEEFDDLLSELEIDPLLSQWFEMEEIKELLNVNFQTQQEGNRKLENIKARIILDKLNSLLLHSKDLQKKCLQKLQGLI